MAESLVSGSWHRVAALRPGLVGGLRIVRQPVRNQVWRLLVEPASGRQLRLNPAAWELVGRFDGRATLDELWQRILYLKREEAPTQDEVLALLAQLFRGGMVQFDAAPHLSLLFARRAEEGARRGRGSVNPLMLRARLGDPSSWLRRLTPFAHGLFSGAGLLVWLVLVALGLLAAATEWAALKAHAGKLLAAPSSYALAWVLYPLVKALHELGHGLAVRRYGGDVREFGVSLMFLTPAPYVDASAANAFATARQRFVVSTAGIVVELGLAAGAVLLWTALAPGLLRDAMLSVALICSASTLAFNGNPLMRLDGYHAMCDALGLPNLAARSSAWWARQFGRALGQQQDAEPLLARGERKWLAVYGPLSWLYRLVLLGGLVLWIGQYSWLAGCAAGLLIAGWLLRNSWRWLDGVGPRARWGGAGIAAAVLVLLFVVPAPQNVVTQGVVWSAPRAQLRADVAGFVQEVAAADGTVAVPGQAVLRLHDPALDASSARLDAERRGLEARHYSVLLSDPVAAQQLAGDLERNAAERARVDEQLAAMEVRAGAAGRIAWARPEDLPGSFAARGALLGHVVVPGAMQLRLALAQEDFSRVAGQVEAVEVRLVDEPHVVHSASLLPGVPGATPELPTAALGDRAGGPIPLDGASKDGARARSPVFLLDARVPGVQASRLGARAWVKLKLPPEPLAEQAGRRLAQLFVKHFRPTGQL